MIRFDKWTLLSTSVALITVAALAVKSHAQQNSPGPNLAHLNFLLGEWVGEGGGDPGQGIGGFTYSLDLQGKVITRRNHADYPATADKPASHHEDLMIIYSLPLASASPNAIYFDNEGHVINYAIDTPKGQNTAVFTSSVSKSGPRFRLTQTVVADTLMSIKFEIAMPAQPDSFSTYIDAKAYKKH